MCNPKPGVRCFNDAHKALVKSVDKFVNACETGDEGKIESAAKALNEDRVFYYATNYTKTNGAEAVASSKKALGSIPGEFKKHLDSETEVHHVGQLLNRFQTVADKYRKGTNLSGLETARKMYNGGFDRVLAHGKEDNQNKRDMRIGAVLDETNDDLPNAETEAIEQEALLKERLLNKAHSYAMADAKKVIDRDSKKNSQKVDGTAKKHVDLQDAQNAEHFKKAPLYRKSTIVSARRTSSVEKLDTVLSNGLVETSREVPAGEWIVTNPGGEQYAISDEKFRSKYEMNGDGQYRAKGVVRAFKNPTGGPVEVMAPWGEKQYGDVNCWFAAGTDEDLSPTKDAYIIGGDEFAATYQNF